VSWTTPFALLFTALGVVSFAAADDPDMLYRDGLRLLQQGQPQSAVDTFRKALKLAPSQPESWKALGVAYETLGDNLDAEEAFHFACLLNPKLPDACLYFGRALYLLDRFADAINVLRAAIGKDAQNPQLYRVEALALEGSGKNEQAEAAFRQAVQFEKNSALNEDPSIDYGVFLYRAGRAEAAAGSLQSAVTHHPDAVRAQLELGCVLLALDRPGEAAEHLQKATALNEKSARAHLLLGRTYQRLGKSELARKELERASQLN
jgi:Flp pilus assembly protein TadD